MGVHHRLAWCGGCSADGCGNLGPVDTTATHLCRAALLQLTIYCGTGCDDGIVAGRLAGRAIVLSPKGAMDYFFYGVHWLVDIRDLRGESWRVRASDPIGSVQARTVGITALEWMGWWPTRHRPIARAWNDLSLSFEE